MLHIEIERERKFNICIEIQSHAQHISPLLSEHIFLPIVCAYTSPIVMEFYLFCSILQFQLISIQIGSYLSLYILHFITEIISNKFLQ